MPFRIVRRSGSSTAVSEIGGERLRIGRGANADLRLDALAVSLEHAIIEPAEREGEEGWAIADRGSLTGTYVNGHAVERVRLAPGDVIEIGGERITVGPAGPAGPGAPLVLELAAAPARVRATGAPEVRAPGIEAPEAREAREIDYVASYSLPRGLFGRAGLGLLAAAVTLVAVVAVALSGRTTAFRPGAVSAGHAARIGAYDCARCHAPWRGPQDRLCVGCHEGRPLHQPTQVRTPPCGDCHFEHRDLPRLTQVSDRRCTDCHGALEVAGGGTPRFARRVTSFGRDHPEFAVTLAGGARARLGSPELLGVGGGDPTTLRFSHRGHLKPGLVTPEGRVELACADCHRPGEDGEMQPIRFADHCARCHRLSFDSRLPDQVAPHDEPRIVRAFLWGAYGEDESWRRMSLEERRRVILRQPERAERLARRPGVAKAASEAELHLYRTACEKCHAVSFPEGGLPQVAPTAIAADRLPFARFPHARHRVDLACDDCHGKAATSEAAADVLLPGIAVCRRCHGEGAAEAPGRARVPSGCADCHRYHTALSAIPSATPSAIPSRGAPAPSPPSAAPPAESGS